MTLGERCDEIVRLIDETLLSCAPSEPEAPPVPAVLTSSTLPRGVNRSEPEILLVRSA